MAPLVSKKRRKNHGSFNPSAHNISYISVWLVALTWHFLTRDGQTVKLESLNWKPFPHRRLRRDSPFNQRGSRVTELGRFASVAIVVIIGDFPCFDIFSNPGHQPFWIMKTNLRKIVGKMKKLPFFSRNSISAKLQGNRIWLTLWRILKATYCDVIKKACIWNRYLAFKYTNTLALMFCRRQSLLF